MNLNTVKATGRNGRILKEDILSHLNIDSDGSNEVPVLTSAKEVPDLTSVKAMAIPIARAQAKIEVLLEDRVVPVTGFTKAMVKSMTEAMVRNKW